MLARGLTPVADTMRRIASSWHCARAQAKRSSRRASPRSSPSSRPASSPCSASTSGCNCATSSATRPSAPPSATRVRFPAPATSASASPTSSASRGPGNSCRRRDQRARGTLRSAADSTVQPPVRIVKTLGDGVMLVSEDVPSLVRLGALARGVRGDRRTPAAAARGHRIRAGAQPRGRLVRASRQPRQPRDGHRTARQRARAGCGP